MSSLADTQYEFLVYRTEMGARRIFGEDWASDQRVVDRLKTELDLIRTKDFASYFLMLSIFIQRVREAGIPVGPGRGSSGGSLVAYVLGITQINPLKYDLLFSRFLSEERSELPDVDVDFSQVRRQEVLDLARDLFGHDQTIQIGAFQRYGWKASIEIIGRIAGMSDDEIHELRGMIPAQILGGRKIARELAFVCEEVPKVQEWMDAHPKYAEALLAADGGYQHMTRHAAGILVMDPTSRDLVPLASPDGEVLVTGWDMYDIERLNLLKLDFLGIRTLDIIQNACDWAGIHPDDIDHDTMDDATKAHFAAGDTLGVFQLEGWGYTKLCQSLKPWEFEHVAALNALYRPGCLEAYVWVKDGKLVDTEDASLEPEDKSIKRINMVDLYVERLHDRVELTYLHPNLEPILGATQGIILYQEQAMRIAVDFASFTENEADKLRKAIGKKRKKDMEALEPKFIDGVIANQPFGDEARDRRLAHLLWDNIAAASRYSWNKSHSVAYGIITFRCMWLKANYPVAWYAALLRSLNDKEKIAQVIGEMRNAGVKLVPPNINESGVDFDVSGRGDSGAVRFGFGGISGLGDSVAIKIAEGREDDPFLSLKDFYLRCPSVPVNIVESLIGAGAFDDLPDDSSEGHDRAWLLTNARIIKANTKLKKKQHPMAEELLSRQEVMEKEREILGFFISMDPFADIRETISQYPPDAVLMGTVNGIRTKTDKNGNLMAFLTVDHPDKGRCSATVFSSVWANCHNVTRGKIVVMQGKDEEWNGRSSFKVDRVMAIY